MKFIISTIAAAVFSVSALAQSTLPQPASQGQPQGQLNTTLAAPNPATPAPPPTINIPQAPDINAKAYIVVDMTAGNQILAGKNATEKLKPASLTKLMTAYLTFQALANKQIFLNQTLPVGERAWKIGGSTMFLKPGMEVPVLDLVKGMIVQSGNDAAMTLAEGVGGSIEHFVEMMNNQARALGMNESHFMNPDGLPQEGHHTTAQDLAILTSHLVTDFPQYFDIFKIKNYYYPGTPTSNSTNRNTLLFRDPTVDGMKTGYTDDAGYCLIGTALRADPSVAINSTTLNGRRLISVVMGTPKEIDRVNDSQKLLNWGYSAYSDVKIYNAGQAVSKLRVWKGRENSVSIGSIMPIVVSVPAGSNGAIKTQVMANDNLVAPIAKGQALGTLKVFAGTTLITTRPLYALSEVPVAGALGRMWDTFMMWIK